MAKRDIHVVPRDGGWAVVREGADRASSLHNTQTEALERARPMGRTDKVEVVTHRPNGQIRNSDSYGNDPFPPKDKK